MNSAVVFAFAGAFLSGALAFAAAWHARRSMAHWAFVIGMLVLALESAFLGLATNAVLPEEMIRWKSFQLFAMSFLPGTWLFFSLSYSRGNYREFVHQWRVVLIAAFFFPMGLALLFHDQLIASVTQLKGNPVVFALNRPGLFLNFLFLSGSVLVLMNLERTFRASVGVMRWRIKFMLLGIGILFAARAYTSSQILLFSAIDLSLQTVNSGALCVASLLVLRSLSREGLDVAVYPSHSVLHNSLTVLLAGIYLLIVGVFAKIVSTFGGESGFTFKAFLILVSLVVLTILLMSDRLRLHTKRFVSRHFQRPIYDYRQIWRSFTESTASCVEQTELCRAVVKLVADTFQVLSVSVWLVDIKKDTLVCAASTSLSEGNASILTPQKSDAIEVINALRNHPEPIDIDSSKENWAAALRRCHPDEFQKGGGRICVPIKSGSDVLGLMALGDRISGIPFLQQDFDLLKCVADQVAAGLCNLQLSQKLLQAKELEAFQTMSVFFVHDLKNTASTLSLMLQNMSVHYDDPAFKEDALRGISKCVDHINDLIRRLTLFRKENAMQMIDSELNVLVSGVLNDLQMPPDITIEKELRPLPKQSFDPEQMNKVVTNLVLNAREAIRGQGEIRIETGRQNGWVLLSVSDNGCGMSPEFAGGSLFRPFRTTKKNGIGIGMFQSKMIVEAHGGKIEVETQIGKGTTFRVLLPSAGN